VPVESLVRKFEHVRFEPSGMTRNMDIPFAKSLTDYIFRWMAMEFVSGYRALNAPKRDKKPAAEQIAEKAGDVPQAESKGFDYGSGLSQQVDQTGNGNGSKPAVSLTARTAPVPAGRLAPVIDPLSQLGTEMQADAPACDVCGSITVRSGTCYKCLNCGNSMGCS
jgi:ribonucleoside-diphosphate reductase alpha chain